MGYSFALLSSIVISQIWLSSRALIGLLCVAFSDCKQCSVTVYWDNWGFPLAHLIELEPLMHSSTPSKQKAGGEAQATFHQYLALF